MCGGVIRDLWRRTSSAAAVMLMIRGHAPPTWSTPVTQRREAEALQFVLDARQDRFTQQAERTERDKALLLLLLLRLSVTSWTELTSTEPHHNFASFTERLHAILFQSIRPPVYRILTFRPLFCVK